MLLHSQRDAHGAHRAREPQSPDAHDLVVGWFYGSGVLDGEGWTSGTDAIRQTDPLRNFPRIANRSQPDRRQQAEALLRGIGLSCSAAHS